MLARQITRPARPGLIGLTKSLARELASRNITRQRSGAGFVITDMTSGLSDEVKNTIHAKIPLGRTGTPDEIASAVAFLASPEAGLHHWPGAVRRWRNRDVRSCSHGS